METDSTSIDALQMIVDADDFAPSRWHSIRLERLKKICRMAIEWQKHENACEIARQANAVAQKTFIPKRAGHDFPCSIHKGPKGDCTESNCRCA